METKTENQTTQEKEFKEITIKFAKGCVGNTFTGKDGNDYTSILIPNQEVNDRRPWQTFVVRANAIHEDKYGKGMWTKLPAEGHTTVRRAVKTGVDENGKSTYINKDTVVSNQDLKEMVEFYKNRSKEQEVTKDAKVEKKPSLKQKMEEKKTEVQKNIAEKGAATKAKTAEAAL